LRDSFVVQQALLIATHRPLLLHSIESSAPRRPPGIAVSSSLGLPNSAFTHIGYTDVDTL